MACIISTKPVIIICSKQLLPCGMHHSAYSRSKQGLHRFKLATAKHGKNLIITVRNEGLLYMTDLAQQVLESLVADRQMWPLCFARAGCMSSLPVS